MVNCCDCVIRSFILLINIVIEFIFVYNFRLSTFVFLSASLFCGGSSTDINDHADLSIQDAGSKVQTGPESVELGFIQRMKLRFFGIVNVGDRMDEGWSSSLPFYAFRCKKHGLQIGYPVGHAKLLLCPECSI